MRPTFLAPLAAAALVLGACGDDSGSDASTGDAASEGGAADTPSPAAGDQPVQTSQTDLGEVLTTAEGLTLYGFTEDTDGTPTCEGACAETWPPLVVDGPDLPSGLDPEVFRVVERPDGTFQIAAGEWPLYLFSGDTAPGDTNGQGSGGVWFVVTPDGQLNRGDAAPAGDSGDGGAEAPAPTEPADTAPEEPATDDTRAEDPGAGDSGGYGDSDDSGGSGDSGYGY